MHRLRFAILGAVAALALGTASAVAMAETAGGGSDPDQHGDKVATAAHTCAHGSDGVHGECVSAVASSKSEGAEAPSTNTCKAADVNEDKSETKPAKGDKAAKAAAKAEDKTEHKTFAACMASQPDTDTEPAEAPETPDASDASES